MRVIFLSTGLSCIAYASMHIDQTFIAIGMNIASLIMCVLSYLILGEVLKNYMKAVISVCFVGCTVIIIGNYMKNGKSDVTKAPVLAWLALLYNSVQGGSSAILMRKMKGIHWITMNLYINIIFITFSAGTLGL